MDCRVTSAARWLGAGAGVAAAGYAAFAALAWWRYGHPQRRVSAAESDPLLDRYLPEYEIVERHRVAVRAPVAVAFAAAVEMDLQRSLLIRTIFRTREFVMRTRPPAEERPHGIVAECLALGWGVLAEVPGREIVVGAVTQPWQADVVFRALPPAEFAAFREPGWVKIAWTLRADPRGAGAAMVRTETRAIATDRAARRAFRRYWALASPGIRVIRRLSMRLVRKDAEDRVRQGLLLAHRPR